MEEEYRGSTSSINYDILSVGIANAQPIAKHHASLINNAGHNEMEQHILPSPNFSRPSPRRPISTGTMEDLRRPQPKRRSIIDPATVRLSFTGSISEVSSPLALPLEEGLQKLYRLYNEYVYHLISLSLTVADIRIQLHLCHTLCRLPTCHYLRLQMPFRITSDRNPRLSLTAHRISAI